MQTHSIPPGELNLDHTLFSGQCFGWDRTEDGFSGFFRWGGATHRAFLRREGDAILAETTAPGDWFGNYFNLSVALEDVIASFPPFPRLKDAVRSFPGLRVLKQDPWETLVAFVISQNNNIARIRLILRRMLDAFGRFPEPEDLLSEERLRGLGLGYRAGYLTRIGEMALSGSFAPAGIARLDTPRALASLMSLPGVGEKVALCVLLYGYGRQDAFPVDVWMRRLGEPKVDYGPYAGWAQLYLYVAARGLC